MGPFTGYPTGHTADVVVNNRLMAYIRMIIECLILFPLVDENMFNINSIIISY
jgi:hypothetical protein